MRMLSLTALAMLAITAGTASADVRMSNIFGSHMVLQQGMPLPFWGQAEPGEAITVTVGDSKAEAKADDQGKWRVDLPAREASAEPTTVTVKGNNTLTFNDVLVGEVWICSGQSNMQWSVAQSNNPQEEIANANYPNIRLITVPRKVAGEPQTNFDGAWAACSPQTVSGFSAVGYYFGRQLHKEKKVPVGLINTSYGGTPAEAWTTRGKLESSPTLKVIVDRWDQQIATYGDRKAKLMEQFEQQMADWKVKAQEAKAAGKQPPQQPRRPQDPAQNSHRTSGLYNAMIAPLVPYAVRGAIWYQGESNAGRAYQYRELFPAMITDWRQQWGQGDFPFLFVQLANFMKRQDQPGESAWAELREAQTMTLTLDNTGMAVIIDAGEANDIHPRDKQTVGQRLAMAARKVAYGDDVVYSGPTFKSARFEGDKAIVTFGNVGNGLMAKGGELKGFAIAGEDKKFHWANASIDGEKVVLTSPQVESPVAVRYGWADNPDVTLYNEEGLPASPFRTDTWPGVTVNNQ